MGKINIGGVLLGGVLAGVIVNVGETILNVVVAGEAMAAALAARNLPPVGGSAIGGFIVITLINRCQQSSDQLPSVVRASASPPPPLARRSR